MKPERKNGKLDVVYKETVGDNLIVVTSRDPRTRVQVLKETIKKTRKKNKIREQGHGVLSILNRL